MHAHWFVKKLSNANYLYTAIWSNPPNLIPAKFFTHVRYYGTISVAIFAGNEASLDTMKKETDIEMKEPEYEVPDLPSVMRMTENEAYGN